MRYFRLLGAVVMAVCAVGAMLASSAFALPTLLIGTTGEGASTWTDAGGGFVELPQIHGFSARVGCNSSAGEGTVEAKKPLGAYHISYKGCHETNFGAACTGAGDESESILFLGSWHLVYDTLKAGLTGSGVAILFLVGKANYNCLGDNFEVKGGGMVLCLIANPEALTKTFQFACRLRSGGGFGPEETKYDNAAGTMVSITPLEVSVDGGASTEAVQGLTGTTTYPEDTLIMV